MPEQTNSAYGRKDGESPGRRHGDSIQRTGEDHALGSNNQGQVLGIIHFGEEAYQFADGTRSSGTADNFETRFEIGSQVGSLRRSPMDGFENVVLDPQPIKFFSSQMDDDDSNFGSANRTQSERLGNGREAQYFCSQRFLCDQTSEWENSGRNGAIHDSLFEVWSSGASVASTLHTQHPIIGIPDDCQYNILGETTTINSVIKNFGTNQDAHETVHTTMDNSSTQERRTQLDGAMRHSRGDDSDIWQTHHLRRSQTIFGGRNIQSTPSGETECIDRFHVCQPGPSPKPSVEFWSRKILTSNHASRCWPSRLPKRRRARIPGLPLHTKITNRVDMAFAETVITEKNLPAWRAACNILFDANSFVGKEFSQETLSAHLETEDIKKLMAANMIREVVREDIRAWVNIFTVDEIRAGLGRRRMISEPKEINDFFTDPGNCPLPSMADILDGVPRTAGAACFDFAAFFPTFSIPTSVQQFYGFEFEGKFYVMTVLSTGQRQCPALAQALSSSIAERVEEQARREGFDVTSTTYIDNIRLAGEKVDVEHAERLLRMLCIQLGITLDLDSTWSNEYDFLGLHIHHLGAQSSVCLAKKTIDKLIDWQDNTEWTNQTMRDVLSVLGLLMWAAGVHKQLLAPYYYLFKFIRRRSHFGLDQQAHVWPTTIQVIRNWIRDIFKSQQSPRIIANPCSPTAAWTAFTDSCLTGYGIILISPCQDITVIAGRWDYVEDIAILECRCVFMLAKLIPRQSTFTNIEIHIDNTSTLGAIKKSRSANFFLNNLSFNITTLLTSKNWLCRYFYVNTKQNLADATSRLFAGRF